MGSIRSSKAQVTISRVSSRLVFSTKPIHEAFEDYGRQKQNLELAEALSTPLQVQRRRFRPLAEDCDEWGRRRQRRCPRGGDLLAEQTALYRRLLQVSSLVGKWGFLGGSVLWRRNVRMCFKTTWLLSGLGIFIGSHGTAQYGWRDSFKWLPTGQDKATHQHKVGRWSLGRVNSYKLPTNISLHWRWWTRSI